jgi:hypothetical protein
MSRNRTLRVFNFSTAYLRAGCLALAVPLIGIADIANAAQTASDDIAAQIRLQGYWCDQPITAHRDVRVSRPDSAVWILKCRDDTYRVRLDPGMAARVTKLK